MMKRLFAAVVVLGFLAAVPSRAEVRTWPLPEGETPNPNWKVSIGGTDVQPLNARTADPPFQKYDYGGDYGIVSVDTDEAITVTVRPDTQVESLTIRPASLGLEAVKTDDGGFSIAIDPARVTIPCQMSIETDGRKHPLLVFVNPLENEIPAADENTIVFGPGSHFPEGGHLTLSSNQTLYLAAGAVVHATLELKGENIRIFGRGVLDCSDWEWTKCPGGLVVAIRESKNVSLSGIIIRGAASWTVVPTNSDDVTIENIKICGGRVQNDDGINPCNSRRVTIRRCFIRTDDDCIALKGMNEEYGNCEDVTVEHVVFWCDRARIVLMGHESRAPYMRRVTFRDCDIIHSQNRNFLLEPGENMRMENLLFENLRFEANPKFELTDSDNRQIDFNNLRFDVDTADKETWLFVGRPAVNRYMKTQVPGYIRDVTIRDITVTGPVGYYGILFSGADEDHTTEGVLIENVVLFGEKQGSDSPRIHLQQFLTGGEIR
ncbi:MAG: hypothetical protein J6S75_04840 [Thermoguttaceae bacterium]|nr:hypothetical protein [Thermoguttaceae bacterium]